MRISNDLLIKAEIRVLLIGTPLVYAVSDIIGNTALYSLKDILMLLITAQILVSVLLNHTPLPRTNVILFMVLVLYIVASSLARLEDTTFWLINIREVLVTPTMLLIIGFYVRKNMQLVPTIWRSLFFTCFLTAAYSLAFKSTSYGLTGRMRSFWDREHEPSIIGGLLIVTTLLMLSESERTFKLYAFSAFAVGMALYCMIQSKSRSPLIATAVAIAVLYMDEIREFMDFKKTIILFIGLGAFVYILSHYTEITGRDLDYNTSARENQYEMAWELISAHPVFGIGIDKYGVLSGNTKVFTYGDYSTTTMDSTLIKYTLNLGMVYVALAALLFLQVFKEFRKVNKKLLSIIAFGLAIGCVTGKLGAYPLNQYFYLVAGFGLFYDVSEDPYIETT